jgi:hypothetical protein
MILLQPKKQKGKGSYALPHFFPTLPLIIFIIASRLRRGNPFSKFLTFCYSYGFPFSQE